MKRPAQLKSAVREIVYRLSPEQMVGAKPNKPAKCKACKQLVWLQAWAVLEAEEGNLGEARRLFQLAADADPQMVHAWHAWGMLELRGGDLAKARQLFQSAVWAKPSNTDACRVWQVCPS